MGIRRVGLGEVSAHAWIYVNYICQYCGEVKEIKMIYNRRLIIILCKKMYHLHKECILQWFSLDTVNSENFALV